MIGTVFFGLCELTIHIPEAQSLKQKRSALRKVLERTKNRFTISVAETGLQDKWQLARLGFAIVSNDRSHVQSMIDKVLMFIEGLFIVQITDVQQDIGVFSSDVEHDGGSDWIDG